jgi:hypothetical protein
MAKGIKQAVPAASRHSVCAAAGGGLPALPLIPAFNGALQTDRVLSFNPRSLRVPSVAMLNFMARRTDLNR